MNQECYEQNMDEAPVCGICDVNMRKKMTKKTGDTASALFAETADFDCVCDTCWPHYIVASMTLAKVLGSQIARANRGGL